MQFLPPKSGCARTLVAVLALPSFLILLVFLIATPIHYVPWPPPTVSQALMLFAICELLAAGCIFTLLALVWAVAAPKWIERMLEGGSRRLILIMAGFLMSMGTGLFVPAVVAGLPVPIVVAIAGFALGVHLLRSTSRSASAR